MNHTLYAHITALPENSWTRHFAERAVANGFQPVAMRNIPEREFRRFANNQQRTVVHENLVCIPLEEFVRIAHITRSNASMLDGVGGPA
jgi:hypothetical protein